MVQTGAGSRAGRLPLRTKLSYGAGEIGAALTYTGINTWLLYFLVNVAGVEPLAAGVVFVLGRIFDALLDPLMGDLADRHRFRVRRLTWVRAGMVPFAVTFVLVWLLPALGGPRLLLAAAALVVFSIVNTAVVVPLLSLTPTLAPSYDGRTTLTAWRMGFSTLGVLVAAAAPPAIVLAVTGEQELATSAPRGWVVMGLVLGLVSLAGYLVVVLGVREPPPRGREEHQPLNAAAVRSAFRVPAFRGVFAMFLVVNVALIAASALLPFYLESVLSMQASEQTAALAGLFGIAIVAIPLWAAAARRGGKRQALVAGMTVHMVGLLALVAVRPTPQAPLALWAILAVLAVGLSAVIVLPWAIIPDAVEFDEAENGLRREGLLYALAALGQKLAGSLGVFGGSLVATVFGYQQGTAVQSAATVNGLALAMGPFLVAIYALAAVLTVRLPVTRQGFEEAVARTARGDAPAA